MKEFTYQDYLKYPEYRRKRFGRLLHEFVEQFDNRETITPNRLCDVSEEYMYNNEKVESNAAFPEKEEKIDKPYDKMFRVILGDKEQMTEIINSTLKLKKKIRKEDIEKYNNAYVVPCFKNRESDIVYKKKDQNIFFLIEHQTKIDYTMPIRILEYEIGIIQSAIDYKKIRKNSKIPKVIPIVIYTGKRKWNAKKYIEECQERLEEEPIRMGEYNVIDINEYEEKELIEKEGFIYKAFLLEKSKTSEELYKNIEKILETKLEEREYKLLKLIIYFIYKPRLGKEKIKEILKKMKKEGGKGMAVVEMLLREKEELIKKGVRKGKTQGITEGKIQGIMEGRQQGITEGKTQGEKEMQEKIIIEMLNLKMDDETIQKVTRISLEELNILKKRNECSK